MSTRTKDRIIAVIFIAIPLLILTATLYGIYTRTPEPDREFQAYMRGFDAGAQNERVNHQIIYGGP